MINDPQIVSERLVSAMHVLIGTDPHTKNQKDFAKAIGTQQYRISKFKIGGFTPTTKNILNFLAAYPQISAEWLLRGKGNMIIKSSDNVLDSVQTLLTDVRSLRRRIAGTGERTAVKRDK